MVNVGSCDLKLGYDGICKVFRTFTVKEEGIADTEFLKKEAPPEGGKDFRPLARRYKRKRFIYWGAAAAVSAIYAGTLIYCISKLADNGDKK